MQIKIAAELNLPIIMHTREAEKDTLEILEEVPLECHGGAHSFTGSFEMASELVGMGWYLGLNGIVTFKNAEKLRDITRWLPLERILLETDAPFLSPIPSSPSSSLRLCR